MVNNFLDVFLSNLRSYIEAISSYYTKRTEEIVEALVETEDETAGIVNCNG